MKNLSVLIFVFLFFACKNSIIFYNKSKIKNQIILLEFNRFEYEPYGILTKKLKPAPQFIEFHRDTFLINNDSTKLLCVKKNKLLKFLYEESEYKLSGQFILPNYRHIHSQHMFNVETYFTEKIVVKPFIKPVRNGEWVLTEKGVDKKIKYDIKIDESYLRK
jgi:hypothetical protein